MIRRKTLQIGLLAMLAATICCFSIAQAKKPTEPPAGGGGGDGTNGGGEIYFDYGSSLYVMDDDGGNITPAVGFPADLSLGGIPSRNLHAGKRWLLDGEPFDAHPILAKSDGGDIAVLHVQSDVQVVNHLAWNVFDLSITFLGVQWDTTTGEVLNGGVFELLYLEDAAGNITEEFGRAELIFELPVVVDERGNIVPDAERFDWAPDGNRFVYNLISAEELRIGNVETGMDDLLFADGTPVGNPLWSPAGTQIVFSKGGGDTMSIELERGRVNRLQRSAPGWSRTVRGWSPSGSHLLFDHRDHSYNDSYILRMTADGADKTRLTGPEIGAGFSRPSVRAWR